MAIPVILPVACQGMVAVSRLQRLLSEQGQQDRAKVSFECGPVLAFGFAFVVALELPGVVSRPH